VAAEAAVPADGALPELDLFLLRVHLGHLRARIVERHHVLEVVEQDLVGRL